MYRIDYTHIKSNAGYITYIKLYFKEFPLWFNTMRALVMFNTATVWFKLQTYISFAALMTILFLQCLVKPFLWPFKTKIQYVGSYSISYRLFNETVVKYVTFYVFYIPIFKCKSKLNDNDWTYILSKSN